MADDRLFDLESIPEVPLFREPRRAKAARGISLDARFANDYPPEWHRCTTCDGVGVGFGGECPACRGMGSLKARVRFEAGHRCERCQHPYIPKGDAKMLGVEPSTFHWSRCDDRCTHGGPIRYMNEADEWAEEPKGTALRVGVDVVPRFAAVDAEWRILTVHHLDGDKSNCRWWNLAALCQIDHLYIQHKVVMERVYPFEHSAWFRPHAAAFYAYTYLGIEPTREETEVHLDEWLALERKA